MPSTEVEHAYINPDVARWARRRNGLTEDELAGQLRVTQQQVVEWEAGRQHPPFGRAQDLARTLKIPFGYLFLSAPPAEAPPIPDLRSVDDQRRPPTPDFIDLLNDVLVKQDWYASYQEELGVKPLEFVGRFSTRTPVAQVLTNIRETVGLDAALRQQARNWSDYLRLLAQNAEAAGVLVMRAGVVRGNPRRRLSVEEFRGFAIASNVAPLVFLNSRDVVAAQIFTLAHELVHIWIGQSGISKPDPTMSQKREASPTAETEEFCNLIAAELLVPAAEFDAGWPQATGEVLVRAEQQARQFRVSVPVILRRAYERGHIGRGVFFSSIEAHRRKVEELERKREEEEAEGGGNFYNTFFARNSNRFVQTALTALRAGSMNTLQAARLLNVRTSTLPKLLERASL
jgi:Zn-dependent peptidase ImmA (M78 family)/DNA-binding XRE family transcriptional regulator